MKVDEATRDALKKFLTGEVSHPAMSPFAKRMLEVFLYVDEHMDELEALREATERGDPEKLAELVETKGELRTPDARVYVAARLRGEPKRRRPAEDDILRRIFLWHRVNDLINEKGLSQSSALRLCLGDAATNSFETIRSDFRQGGSELREVLETLGFSVGPALQVKEDSGGAK